MLVNTSQKNKGEVFESHKKEFREIFVQLEVLDKQRVEINANINSNIGPFSHIVASVSGDASKSEFY
jgi:hypothetical protein